MNTDEFILIDSVSSIEYTDIFPDIENPLTDIYYKVRAFNSEIEFGPFSDIDYGYYTGRSYDEILSFGKEGNDPGEFRFSWNVTVDESGIFYIPDYGNDVIQKFSTDGIFLEIYYSCYNVTEMKFINPDETLIACAGLNMIKIIDADKNTIREWGGYGSGNGQFNNFNQIAIDEDDYIYVTDIYNYRIQKMDLQGNFILKWGTEGEENGQFSSPPWGITIFKDMVVVSTSGGKKVQFFTKQGEFIKSWDFDQSCNGLASDDTHLYIAAGDVILKVDEEKKYIDKIGDGDFVSVQGITIKDNGDVVAMDTYGRKLKVYRKN